jgi:hypothetical protein
MAYAGEMMESVPSATIDSVSASFYGAISHHSMLYNHSIAYPNPNGILLASNNSKPIPTLPPPPPTIPTATATATTATTSSSTSSEKLYIHGALNSNYINTNNALIVSPSGDRSGGRPPMMMMMPKKKKSLSSGRRCETAETNIVVVDIVV